MKLGAIPEGLVERLALWRGALPTPIVETLQAALLARTVLVGTKVGVFEVLDARRLRTLPGGVLQPARKP